MDINGIMELVIPIAAVFGIGFALYLARDVLGRDRGTPEMQEIASTIFEGAMAFLRRQYGTIAALALVTSVLVGILIAFIPSSNAGTTIDQATLGVLTAVAFLLGAVAS